jgi:hypothetical protein
MRFGKPIIEFSTHENLKQLVPAVRPALFSIPAEYRRLSARYDNPEAARASTVKACLPYFDAMTSGFIIPLPLDIRITVSEGSLRYVHAASEYAPDGRRSNNATWLGHHPSAQGTDAMAERAILKLMSPYYIKTRRGWGSLFLPLLNRDTPLAAIAGLVDTSKYRSLVNIPFLWDGSDGDFEFSQGEPLAQVIPVPLGNYRYSYEAISAAEAEQRDVDGQRCVMTHNVYVSHFRKRLTFSKE